MREDADVVQLELLPGLAERYRGRSRRRVLSAMRYELEMLSDGTLAAVSRLMEADLAGVEGPVPVEPLTCLGDVIGEPAEGAASVPLGASADEQVQQLKRQHALPLLRAIKTRPEDRR